MRSNIILNKFFAIFFICCSIIICQDRFKIESLQSDFAKSENKEKYYRNLVKNVQFVLNSKLNNTKEWISALRDAQTIFLKNNFVENGLKKILVNEPDLHIKLQRVALEVAYTLYPNQFEEQISTIANTTVDVRSFVVAAHYLTSINNKKYPPEFFLELSNEKFTNISSLLREFQNYFANNSEKLPKISNLLSHSFQQGKTIIFSFHRKNRKYPGVTIIKEANGEFVRKDDSSLFFIPQLALSFSNLPSYIPNGNTPQGIYSILGWYISPTKTIGPTPNVLVRSPYEVTPDIYFHDSNMTEKWSKNLYEKLLPPNWIGYKPIYDSYFSGKIGRKLIIIHGSTDEQKYFENQQYHPLVPTRGCLSSKEEWDARTGKCIESDQLDLINKFINTNQTKGFLVVLEIDDADRPVTIDEIEKYIK